VKANYLSATAIGSVLLAFSTLAVAQQPTSSPSAPSVPSTPSVVVHPLVVSPMPISRDPAFVAPPPVRDEAEVEWRTANDEAARLGGHVGQLRGRR
jgi:hypothetical protein